MNLRLKKICTTLAIILFVIMVALTISTINAEASSKTSFKNTKPVITEVFLNCEDCFVVHWKEIKNVSGYDIYRATSKNGTYNKVGNEKYVYYFDYNVKNHGKVYYYKVRAYKKSNGVKVYSKYSNTYAKRYTVYCRGASKATMTNSGKVTLTASECKNAAGYYIYYSTKEEGTY